MAGIGQFEVQSRGAMGQAGNVRGAADGIDDARRNHCRRCVRCVRHGSSLLPYATVFHYRRWVPQKHGNAGKASRNGNYALRCSAMVSRHNVPLWCSAAPVLRICRSAHSDFIPPCRILQSLSKIIVFCRLFGVSRPRKSYPIFHTRCVAGLLLKMRQDLE